MSPSAPSAASAASQRCPPALALALVDEEKTADLHELEQEEPRALSSRPDHPWRVKGPAIALALLLTLGSNYATSIIPPLKSTLKKEFEINNAQYAVLDTASSLINTLLPVLSGLAIDYYGPTSCGVCASSMIFLGALLTAIATSLRLYPLMVVGEIVAGLGGTTVQTVQYRVYAWYSGSCPALVFAVDVSVGRVWDLSGSLSAVPLMEGTGRWSWPFWLGFILCGVGLGASVALAMLERSFPSTSRVPSSNGLTTTSRAKEPPQTFHRRISQDLKFISSSLSAIPSIFWLIQISQLGQSGAVQSYGASLADAIRVTRGTSLEEAGYTSAISHVIPIVLTPCLGYVFDSWGRRMHWVTATAALYVVVFSLLAFTKVDAIVPSILGSLALATNILPWIVTVPLLVPDQRHLGTAFGIYKSFINCGTVIVTVASGAIQDLSASGGREQYKGTFAFLIAIKGLDIGLGLVYGWVDGRLLGGVLRMNERERSARVTAEQAQGVKGQEAGGGVRGTRKEVTRAAVGVLVVMNVLAWVLYLYYSV